MIQLADVWYRIGGNTIFHGIDLQVNTNEFVYVVGLSGSGKSTLLRLINMEVFPYRGTIIVSDYNSRTIRPNEIPYLRRKIGMVFQDYKLLEDRNVYENVAFALWATGVPRRRIKKRVFQVLADVGLSHKRYSLIHELSGGEQQRVAIARALANEPFVLLADEPTGNLDAESTDEILLLLKRINSRGTAVVMTTHRLELVQKYSGKLIRIMEGKLVG